MAAKSDTATNTRRHDEIRRRYLLPTLRSVAMGDDPEERVAVHRVPTQRMRSLHICRYFYAEVDTLLDKVRSVTPLEQGAEDKAREVSRIIAHAGLAASGAASWKPPVAAASKSKPAYQLESETTLLVPMVCLILMRFSVSLPAAMLLLLFTVRGNRRTTPTWCTLANLQNSLACFPKAVRATCVTVCCPWHHHNHNKRAT